jgi:hypothetical protein
MKPRNEANRAAGWFLAVGLLVAGVALDPLALYRPPVDDGPQGFFLWVVLIMAMVSLGSYTFFAKPFIAVQDNQLIVQNPLTRWKLPLRDVTLVPDSYPYASVRVGSKRVWLMAAEYSLTSQILGSRVEGWLGTRVAEGSEHDLGSMKRNVETTAPIEKALTLVDLPQAMLAALWLSYVAVSLTW